MSIPADPALSSQTKLSLLLAAEKLIVEEGVFALTVRRIADKAEVNSALIRYHFGNTQELLRKLAHLNVASINASRQQLLNAMEGQGGPSFETSVDALIVPLWAQAALSDDQRAFVVLDEIYSRSDVALQMEVWELFADGVHAVSLALKSCLPGVDDAALAWRIRFVTAAALDIPPRSPRITEFAPDGPVFGPKSVPLRLDNFRAFAMQALREIAPLS